MAEINMGNRVTAKLQSLSALLFMHVVITLIVVYAVRLLPRQRIHALRRPR